MPSMGLRSRRPRGWRKGRTRNGGVVKRLGAKFEGRIQSIEDIQGTVVEALRASSYDKVADEY